MDLRKVQLTGGASLSVTLPKAWSQQARVHQGDVVGCVQQPDGSLSIHPHVQGERPLHRYRFDPGEEEGEYLFRKIVAAYLMGYDAIIVHSKRPLSASARLTIRKAVGRIIGLEVVDEEPTSITLQDFLDPREFHVDKALRRMGVLTQAMQDEALSMVRKPSQEALRSVRERDDEVDRLYWLVNKQYHAMLRDAGYAARMGLDVSQALNVLLVARVVERTADHAGRIADRALALAEARPAASVAERVEKDGRRAVQLFREALEVFQRPDAARANALIEEAGRFLKSQERLLREVANAGGEALTHLVVILESVGRTAAYAADIGEVAINHKVATEAVVE